MPDRASRVGRSPRDAAAVAVPLFLFAAALAVRAALVAATGFDGLYGQDPYAYFDYALRLRAALASLHAPPPFFYPIGYPLLVALATAVLGVRPLAGQAVSILAGALAAPACWGLVRTIDENASRGALVAGLAVAFAPQAVISSLSVNSDAAAFAFAALSAWALARDIARPRTGTLALAALALGAAVLTRWVYGLLALPWAVAAALAWRSKGVRRALGAALLAAALAAAVVGFQFVGEIGRGPVSHAGDVAMARWSPAHALERRITNPDGAFAYPVPVAVYYLLPLARPAFVFPLLTPFLLLGVVSLRAAHRPHAFLLLGWLVTMLVFFAGFAWENPRFPLSYFTPLAALVGLGAAYATQRRGGGAVATAVCAAGLAASALWAVRDTRAFVAQKSADLAAARWCRTVLPSDARLLSFGLTETIRHYTPLDVGELADANPATLAAWLGERRPAYVLVDGANLDTQWRGLAPQANMAWIRSHADLAEVGRWGRYTLWRIGGASPAGHVRQEAG